MARTRAVTVLFCDLVASTERRARLGDDDFDEFTLRFVAALRETVERTDGREVKSAGDGLMVAFESSVADAVACAIAMHEAMGEVDRLDPPRLRIGISTGEVAQDGDDYSGMPIVEAARLEAAAAPGQTLANAIVRTLVGSRGNYRFRDVGVLALKGLPEPLPAIEVFGAVRAVDPGEAAIAPDKSVAGRHGGARSARRDVRGGGRRRWPIVTAVVVVLLVAAGLALSKARSDSGTPATATAGAAGVVAPNGYTPQYRDTPCPSDVTDVAPDATCGMLTVPQDRSKPKDRTIDLLVTRAPPRTAGPAVAPSIDVCGCEDANNSVTRDHAELIHLALRGFKGSDPELACPAMSGVRLPALALRSDDATQLGIAESSLAQCHAQLVSARVDPAQYNYVEAARDVLDLMFALHIERADFTSYGSNDVIVFSIMRQAPAAIRSITLDNATAPDESPFTDPIKNLADAYGRFVGLCGADAECARDYPDLAGAFRLLQANAAASPAPPYPTPNPSDDSAAPISILLDSHRNADALIQALDVAGTYRLIPSVITDPTSGPIVASQALQRNQPDWNPDAAWGALASYNCSFLVHTADHDAIAQDQRSLPEFVGDADTHWDQWCRSWPVPDVSEQLGTAVASTTPAFLFRGDLSPFGNSDAVAKILRGLPNGQRVIFPTLGGDLLASGPPCLSDLRRQFLADPMAKLDMEACVASQPAIEFAPPAH